MNVKKILCLATAVLCFSGCSSQKTEPSGEDKIAVTMLYTSDLPNSEKLVETTYTNIDLQIERNAQGTIDGEVERRLRNGHASDEFDMLPLSCSERSRARRSTRRRTGRRRWNFLREAK